jgi:hypothetical protein
MEVHSLYWTPKLHKYVLTHCYFPWKSNAPLNLCILLTSLPALQTGLLSSFYINYSKGGVNQMWILKNSKDNFF